MIKKLFAKYQHLITYVFFGAVTTAVNFAVYYPLFNICQLSALVSNAVAWLVAVIVAFILRKTTFKEMSAPFVMELPDYKLPTIRGILMHTLEKYT